MNKLTFSNFAKILRPFLSEGKSYSDYTRDLFLMIVTDTENSFIIDYINNLEVSTWNCYYSGKHDISRFAPRITKYVDVPKFGSFVANISEDAKILLSKELKPYIRGLNEDNVADKTASLFRDIIFEAAKRTRTPKKIPTQVADKDIDILKIDDDLKIIINGLAQIEKSEICKLRMNPIAVENKIEKENEILLQKISWQVNTYYYRVEELFKQLGNIKGKKFNSIAFVITSKYRALSKDERFNQNQIFEFLVDWLKNLFPDTSRDCCEIVISFFVQNCEVFDELP